MQERDLDYFRAHLDADLEARISLAVSTGRLDLSDSGMSSFPFALHFDVLFNILYFFECYQFQS